MQFLDKKEVRTLQHKQNRPTCDKQPLCGKIITTFMLFLLRRALEPQIAFCSPHSTPGPGPDGFRGVALAACDLASLKKPCMYRADWELAASSGRRVLGVSLGCPAVLWGAIYTQFNSGVMETPFFEKLADFFLRACGCVVNLPHVAQVRFLQPKRPYFDQKACRLAIPLIRDKKLQTFQKASIFFFYLLCVKRGCFGSKNGVWGNLDQV